MKTTILLLCALIAFASAGSITTQTTYTDVDESQWRTGDIGNSLNYGIQQILSIALKANKIADADYALSTINSVQQKTSGKGVNYKFNIVLTNSDGSSTMTTTFVVYFVSSSGYRYVSSFSYNVKTTINVPKPTPLGDYVKLCPTKIENNQDLKEALDWAMTCVYDSGVNAGKIPEDNYTVLNMTVWKQELTNGLNYKVEVELDNGKTISLFENFVLYVPTSGKKMMTYWFYKATGIPVSGN